ncbi:MULTISPECIES: hypothetical protein [Rhizobium]|jgi:hypothetical protein|uniref:hypothetical protein n=1 Tax=Rhizobium TaxID=379 RepID=UPI0010319591|nr:MULTISPECIES: hypothetical protein [Rhizobium]TBY60381.1 hypothetical protein E0H46_31455 [Rhizobium leguminosarum bv. viciae]MBY3483303.1 hypothetical protein [Rhizobium laguerreae]NEH83064.1 hypothetical protein [Rhizobium ruizarguesonis]NEJ27012.1 hypothetical protein [Rhizobium ruizarguesonis]TBF82597.1 hypothetical protein ELG86_10865 [Rhizobium leguminosarum]
MTSNLVQKKNCFVVGPIGDDDSDDRTHADWLLEDIIEPLFREHFQDFDVRRADKISNPGQITSQVITALLEAELVIADLTTLNPNAFYEIGIRHTIQKPIIHMHLEGQRIPFDIAPFRSIKFSRRRPSDIRAARGLLHAAVTEAIKPDHQIDNPVTFSRGKLDFEQTATPKEKIIEEALNSMTRRLSALEEDSLLGLDMFRRTRHHYFKKPPRGVHKIIMTVTSRNSVNNREFVEEVARWAGISFESFGIETSDDLLHQVSVIIDESDENQIKAEQFVQDYRGDGYEIRLHNSGPTDNFS